MSRLTQSMNSTLSTGGTEELATWLSQFKEAIVKYDISGVLDLFADDECFWRDFVAFTWNIQTLESKDAIAAMLEATLEATSASGWELSGDAREANGLVEGNLTFETSVARCRGYVKLKGGKCWVLFTAAWELKGHEEEASKFRPIGLPYGSVRNRKTWLQKKEEEEKELECNKRPYCVIVGGGQAGIMLGARLKVLGVPTIILEKNDKAGDSWRNRYERLYTHTLICMDHFPFMPFPTSWPTFSSKEQLGDFHEAYTKIMGLNYWCSSECCSATFDQKEGRWNVLVRSTKSSVMKELHPVHLIFATGGSGFPFVPKFRGAESFEGTQCHSSQYRRGSDWTGKQCVVIGACTSGHDICQDLWEQGAAQVTMVQKSSTCVIGIHSQYEHPNPEVMQDAPLATLERFEPMLFATPYKVMHRITIPITKKIAENDAEFYSDLAKVGFRTDFGEDGSGLLMKLLRRQGGYYIDMGASQLIIDGEIKVKSGVNVQEVRPKSILFDDGSEVPADLIVYATGYANMKEFIAKIISQETADKLGLFWGLGSNTTNDPGPWVGEHRNIFKPLSQPNLWMTGGSFSPTRMMSRYLSIQLKARFEGIQTPVYNDPASHRSS